MGEKTFHAEVVISDFTGRMRDFMGLGQHRGRSVELRGETGGAVAGEHEHRDFRCWFNEWRTMGGTSSGINPCPGRGVFRDERSAGCLVFPAHGPGRSSTFERRKPEGCGGLTGRVD